ncbi:MAG: hypothetical protein ACR2Q3_10560 [Woeseiaceae bacterium]
MPEDQSFTLSEAEARRMRRGAFLPVLLILPMAAMFGFDQSKSQPMHFLMVFSVAAVIATIVVSIGWYGAKRRIDEFSRTVLTITPDRLVWNSSLGQSELELGDIDAVSIIKVRGSVRSVSLVRSTGVRTLLEGYADMDVIAEKLSNYVNCDAVSTNAWFSI